MADWDREIGAMTLFVPDLSEARKFYADVFGLEAQPMDEDTAMLRFGDMAVFLRKAAAAAQPLPEILEEARKGAGQFAIIVGDVDGVCAEIASRGVRPLSRAGSGCPPDPSRSGRRVVRVPRRGARHGPRSR